MPVPYSAYDLTFVDTLPLIAHGSHQYRALREGLNQLLEDRKGQHLRVDVPAETVAGRASELVITAFRNAAYNWSDSVGLAKQGKHVATAKIENGDGSVSVFISIVPMAKK